MASEFLRVDLMLVIGYALHNELRPEWVGKKVLENERKWFVAWLLEKVEALTLRLRN
jgi:hypothetical protein